MKKLPQINVSNLIISIRNNDLLMVNSEIFNFIILFLISQENYKVINSTQNNGQIVKFNQELKNNEYAIVNINQSKEEEIINLRESILQSEVNEEKKNLILKLFDFSNLRDLKKIYRKSVLKIHPNKGGDENTFKLLQSTYEEMTEILSSDIKKEPILIGKLEDNVTVEIIGGQVLIYNGNEDQIIKNLIRNLGIRLINSNDLYFSLQHHFFGNQREITTDINDSRIVPLLLVSDNAKTEEIMLFLKNNSKRKI